MVSFLLLAFSGGVQAMDVTIPVKTLPGTYNSSDGYVSNEVLVRPDGTLLWYWRPDHPGAETLTGTWRYDGTTVTVHMTGSEGAYFYKFVPVHWGDRHYLVDVKNIRDFAGDAMRWWLQNRDERSQRSELFRGPLIKGEPSSPKPRSGRPIAPKKYAPWFEWGPG